MEKQRMLRALEPGPGAGLRGLVGKRKVVVCGALLAWFLAVHLLVNIWLLCILSGLLAVLGGWLGSRAILSTRSRLHLERFILLETCPGSPEAERQLEEEIESMIQKIVRDFVSSWYQTVSSERGFEGQVRKAMSGLVLALRRRMALADKQALAQKILLLWGCHLQSYMKAKERVGAARSPAEAAQLWQAYGELFAPHPAVQSPAMEVSYSRSIVDLLLQELVPKPHLETRTGRFVVVELVTCNVLLPMVKKMSDPDWINLLLIGIFSKTGSKGVGKGRGEEPLLAATPCPPAVPNSLPLKVVAPSPSPSELPSYDGVDRAEEGDGGKEPPGKEAGADGRKARSTPVHFPQLDALGSLFPCDDSEVESPMSDVGRDSGSVALLSTEEFLTEPFAALEDPEDSVCTKDGYLEDSTTSSSETRALPSLLGRCPDTQPDFSMDTEESSSSAPLLLPDAEKPFSRRPSFLDSPAQSPQDPCQLPLPSSQTFSFEPLTSPDSPAVIQNLRITGTITAREHTGTGFHPYTLYTIKYETALEGNNASSLQRVAYHTVNRRYREFLNLQTRLEEKPELRKFIKNVKGPKKLFPDLPFGNMDSDKVEARKGLLESFLKQLCSIPEIANSEEVQEFLALNTDARIAFVKKPFVVSRIDKIMVNAIVDTLKTAFPRSEPQSPTDELSEVEVDGKSQTDGKRANKPRLRFPSSKIAPVLSVAEAHERLVYGLREGSAVSGAGSLHGMESFLQKQEQLLEATSCEASENQAPGSMPVPQQVVCRKGDTGSETPLADTALDLLHLLMADHWSWLCTENMHKVLHLLFGSLIQRWLEVQVANLTCTQRWVQYLRLLQESIWPGGVLPAVPKPVRTQEQKEAAVQQALQSLMGILPDVILEILGTSRCQLRWNLILESLQQPIINRHLVYRLLDVLLEFLILNNSGEDPKTTAVASSVSSSFQTAGTSPG